ncbi:MAG: M23 family metallopeptidase [Bacteroidia bacterium]|nr:M23 family metallopeptidase [Bacteroidia bacterium]
MSDKRLLFLPALTGFLVFVLFAAIPAESYLYPMEGYYALAGTFGELRPDHFHSGIDIKTSGRTGVPILAVQDGYVYRIKVSPFGFGKAIYLKHPDGRYSVYGHLSRFNEAIEAYTLKQQYATEQFSQEIYLTSTDFPVKQGDIIAFSGNTGSSAGPHLHFEIRDPEEHILNPLSYYKHLITDSKKPVVQEIAIEPTDINARVNGEFRKVKLVPAGTEGVYQLSSPVYITGKVGIEYQAYDLLDGAANQCGINTARLYLDDRMIYEYDLRKFAFDVKRFINLHIDYANYKENKVRLEKSYVEAGNHFEAYTPIARQGIIELTDNRPHTFRLLLSDIHGNSSTVTGTLIPAPENNPFPPAPTYYTVPKVSYEIRRNVLVLTAARAHKSFREGLRYKDVFGDEKTLMPAYMKGSAMVFLLPLARFDYPVEMWDQEGVWREKFNLIEEVTADNNNLVEVEELQLFFPYEAVFDRVHLEVKKKPGLPGMYSDIYQVGNENIPLNKSYLVSFKPKSGAARNHLIVAQRIRGQWKYAGNTLGEDANVYAAMTEFGEFCLMADTAPPVLEPLDIADQAKIPATQGKISFRLNDDFSGIDHYEIRGTLNGQWKLFDYNYKTQTITWDINKNRPTPGTYTLTITAKDKANNRVEKSWQVLF